MAGGPFPPFFAMQPMLGLLQASQQGQGVPPSPQPAATPAPPPLAPSAPGATEAGGGGAGGQGVMQGIGSALNRAMSGEGIFGTTLEGEADPNTGMSPEQSRRMNMQSIMKMGMMLMAAGGRQSDESRSRIMAQLPSTLDNSDQINSFARNRLEMAKVKLLEKEAARDAAMGAAIDARYGTGGAPTPTVPAGTPVAAPGGVPGAVPAPGAPPVAPGVPGAPGAVLAGGQGADTILPSRPNPPPPPQYVPTPDERVTISTLTKANPKEAMKYVEQRQAQVANNEVAGPRYYDENGNVLQDIYKNGSVARTVEVSDAPKSVQQRDLGGGITRVDTIQGGRVVDTKQLEDPNEITLRRENQKFVREDARTFEKIYADEVKPAVRTYERAIKLAGEVDNGQGNFGTLADARRALLTAAATTGIIKEEGVKDLLTNLGVSQVTGEAAGQLLSKYYKPASNIDVETVNRLTGALNTTDRKTVAEALRQIANSQKNAIQLHNDRVEAHNQRAKTLGMNEFMAPKAELPEIAAPVAAPVATPAPTGAAPPKVRKIIKDPTTGKLRFE